MMNQDQTTCKQSAGSFVPKINPNRCEGKGSCVSACPYSVLAMGVLPNAERGNLTLLGRIKAFAHRYRQAQVLAGDQCQACGLCVSVCPEKAITLVRNLSA